MNFICCSDCSWVFLIFRIEGKFVTFVFVGLSEKPYGDTGVHPQPGQLHEPLGLRPGREIIYFSDFFLMLFKVILIHIYISIILGFFSYIFRLYSLVILSSKNMLPRQFHPIGCCLVIFNFLLNPEKFLNKFLLIFLRPKLPLLLLFIAFPII